MTLLDDFKKFIADAESGQQYAKWAQDNPSDLSKWLTFQNAILAGQHPVIPTMSTPHGRELVDAGIEYLDATAPTPTPTPPPPTPVPSGSTRHFGVLRLGNSWATLASPQNYGLVCGNAADADLVAKVPNTSKRVVYTSTVDVPSWWAGLSQSEVIANGWALGTEAVGYFLDIGNPAVQAQWAKEVGDFCVAHNIDGVYADDFVCDPRTLMTGNILLPLGAKPSNPLSMAMRPISPRELEVQKDGLMRTYKVSEHDALLTALGVNMPTKYPTLKDWHDKALIPFAKNAFGALKARGIYIGANVITWFPSGGETTIWPGTDQNTGTAMQALYKEICQYLSWIMLEDGFFPNNSAIRKEYASSPQWPAFWKNYRDLIPLAESLGCDFYATINAANATAAIYTRATFEIASTGRMGGPLLFTGTDPTALGGNWMKDLGAAKGAATQSGNVFTRQFANGTVTIDPYAGTASIS